MKIGEVHGEESARWQNDCKEELKMDEGCDQKKLKMGEECIKEKSRMGENCNKDKLKMGEDSEDESSTANQVGSFADEWKGVAGWCVLMGRKEPVFEKNQNLS